MKLVKPSSSYEIQLPDDVCKQFDEQVGSVWLDGNPTLLQLSSYIRSEGDQVNARNRLRVRIAKQKEKWYDLQPLYPDRTIDQAAAEFTDGNALLWIHTYLVWPYLTIYATISGPPEVVHEADNWALKGVRTIRLIKQ